MKPFALAVSAAGAVVALTACSHSPAASLAPSGSSNVSSSAASPSAASHSAAPVDCPAQYDAWRHGPAKKAIAAIHAVDSASKAKSASARTAAVKKAGPAVVKAARYPIPACADPQGYWTALLMHVNAAAGSVGSASGRASVALALKGISTLDRRLSAELKRTTGLS